MILAIIQARMLSRRLPGKVMKEIQGKPLIGYMLDRLKYSQRIDKMIVATSINKENDVLCDYLQSESVDVFRGSEDDVLGRYYFAAKPYAPKAVVRLTADCPLIDPFVCDALIESYRKEKCDYAYTDPSFAEGLDCEILSYPILEQIHGAAKLKSEREHVARYLRNHRETFNIYPLTNHEDHSRYRIVVDEPEDFLAVKAIIENLSERDVSVEERLSFKTIKDYLDTHPDIIKLNAHIVRNEGLAKSLSMDGPME